MCSLITGHWRLLHFLQHSLRGSSCGRLALQGAAAPAMNRSEIQNGTIGRICPQAVSVDLPPCLLRSANNGQGPAWLPIAGVFVPLYVSGQYNASTFNQTLAAAAAAAGNSSAAPAQDPRTTEDCLFLDVTVPRDILENAGNGFGAPVLVWIYGGGYTLGSKDGRTRSNMEI